MTSMFDGLQRSLRAVTPKAVLASLPLVCATLSAAPAMAQDGAEPYIGEIRAFAGSFCPLGWSEANGQLLAIASNDALFSLYTTTYGGDGRTTFALPDLRGRSNIEMGDGPGLQPVRLGEKSGAEQVTLTVNQIPSHTHTLSAINDAGTQTTPAGNLLAQPNTNGTTGNLYAPDTPSVSMGTGTISQTGQSQPHNNMAPYLVIKWCVAMQGIYPSRS
ncbi:phage tail protein [Sagittula sp. S175]|uniref:phage tail protein n=1 Tax=Sagittula sp. S175 TaxID=3415129 RepID=UPI003C797F42